MRRKMEAVGNESLELGQKQLPCWLIGVPRIELVLTRVDNVGGQSRKMVLLGERHVNMQDGAQKRAWGGVGDVARRRKRRGVCGGECATGEGVMVAGKEED